MRFLLSVSPFSRCPDPSPSPAPPFLQPFPFLFSLYPFAWTGVNFLEIRGKNSPPLLSPLSPEEAWSDPHQLLCSPFSHTPAPARLCPSRPQNCPCPQVTSFLVPKSGSHISVSVLPSPQQRLTCPVPPPPRSWPSFPSTSRDSSVPLSAPCCPGLDPRVSAHPASLQVARL